MTWSFQGFSEAISTSVGKPSGSASGDACAVLITGFTGGGGVHTAATGFTKITGSDTGSIGGNVHHSAYYRIFDGSEGASFSFSVTLESYAISLVLERESGGAATFDNAVTATGNSTTLASGSLTMGGASGRRLVAFMSSFGNTITPPSGFTGRTDPDGGDSILADADQDASPESASATVSGSTQWGITLGSFNPPAGGGAGLPPGLGPAVGMDPPILTEPALGRY
jgi:hypothetical protein